MLALFWGVRKKMGGLYADDWLLEARGGGVEWKICLLIFSFGMLDCLL